MPNAKQSLGLTAAALLAGVGATAHHDVLTDIDLNAPVEVTGQVERVDWGNPHSILILRLPRGGQVDQVWTVQLDGTGALSESAFSEPAVATQEWVRVLLYPSLQDDCGDICFGYGLSLTTESGNTYTLRQDIRAALTDWLAERR